MQKPIYLDYNATTPHDPEVIETMRPFLEEEFGNPSSAHFYGSRPRQAVATAREQIASLINCRPQSIRPERCRCIIYSRWPQAEQFNAWRGSGVGGTAGN